MNYYLLPLACKNTFVILLDNAGWIIRKMLYILFNVDRINQWYSSKNEASRHSIYLQIVRPNK